MTINRYQVVNAPVLLSVTVMTVKYHICAMSSLDYQSGSGFGPFVFSRSGLITIAHYPVLALHRNPATYVVWFSADIHPENPKTYVLTATP